MSDAAREAALAHFGVKGMRWGVRKSRSSGGSGGSGGSVKQKPKKTPASAVKNLTPEQRQQILAAKAARREAYIKTGKEITKAVLIAAGTVAIASVAGPFVAAGAGAIARALPGDAFGTTITTREIVSDGRGGARYVSETRGSDGGVSRITGPVENIQPRR